MSIWACSSCTFENAALHLSCDMCQTPRPNPSDTIPSTDELCILCQVKPQRLRKCTGCQSVSYCSKECQKLHWKVHKKACKASKKKSTKAKTKKKLPTASKPSATTPQPKIQTEPQGETKTTEKVTNAFKASNIFVLAIRGATGDGGTFSLELPSHTTISQLADQIATRCNMEVSDTRLLCNGQIISTRPFADLKSCGLNDGDFILVSRKPKIVPKSTIYEVQRKKETDEEFARRLQQEENDALAERQRQSTQLQFDAPASSSTTSNRKSRNKNKKKKKKKKKNNTNSTENTFNGIFAVGDLATYLHNGRKEVVEILKIHPGLPAPIEFYTTKVLETEEQERMGFEPQITFGSQKLIQYLSAAEILARERKMSKKQQNQKKEKSLSNNGTSSPTRKKKKKYKIDHNGNRIVVNQEDDDEMALLESLMSQNRLDKSRTKKNSNGGGGGGSEIDEDEVAEKARMRQQLKERMAQKRKGRKKMTSKEKKEMAAKRAASQSGAAAQKEEGDDVHDDESDDDSDE